MVDLQAELEEKKAELQAKADETSTDLKEVNAKLEQAKEEEARRLAAEEEAREASASGSSGSSASGGTTNTGAIDASVDEVTLMAALLDCEAHHEYNAMLAVATVIMNRVEDPRFPNTIRGVIYAKGQFEPVWTGRLESALNRGSYQPGTGSNPGCCQRQAACLGCRLLLLPVRAIYRQRRRGYWETTYSSGAGRFGFVEGNFRIADTNRKRQRSFFQKRIQKRGTGIWIPFHELRKITEPENQLKAGFAAC